MLREDPKSEKVKAIDDEINEINRKIRDIYSSLNFLHEKKIIRSDLKSDVFNKLEEAWEKMHFFSSSFKKIDKDLGETSYALIHSLSEKYRENNENK